MMQKSRSTIQSIDRALSVLKALSQKREGASALDLAKATGIERTTIHRLVRTLAKGGLIEVRGSTYVIGPACLTLGIARLEGMNLRRVALPYAVDMQQNAVGKRPVVVSISARSYDEVVIVERIWTVSTPLNLIMDIGMRFPIDLSVSGRAILSTMENEPLIQLLGLKRYRRIAPRLREIRQRGGLEFAESEFRLGVAAMACPLTDGKGQAVGGLVVGGVGLEPDLRSTSKLAQYLRRSADGISAMLQSAR